MKQPDYWSKGIERLGQSLFPALCVSCKRRIYEQSDFADLCTRCCARFPWRRGEERVLPVLSWRFKLLLPESSRVLERTTSCIAALHYRGQIPFLLRTLKFNQKLCHAKPLGEILGFCIGQVIPAEELETFTVCPVPLSKQRLRQRAYNQAAALAKHAAVEAGLSYRELLNKVRDAPKQSEFEYLERLQNVAGVFLASEDMAGKNILLIDDILTSGATLFSATQACLAAGATRVVAAVVASGRRPEAQKRRLVLDR